MAGMKGKLTITVHKARNLKDTNFVSKLDPYVQLWTDGEKFKTKVHENAGKDPIWEQSFIFNLEGKEDILHLHVYDKETLSDDSIGRADLNLKTGIKYGVQEWYGIVDKDNFSKKTGEICLTFTFQGTGGPAAAPAAATPTPAPAAATPTPAPVVQQPTPMVQQPVQSFGQPAPQYGAPQYPAGYPQQPMMGAPMGYGQPMMGAPMGYPGQPMMMQQPMMMPQQPQVVYVQQPAQPQVVVMQSAAAPVASAAGKFVPLASSASGTQGVFIHVAGSNNLRIEDDGGPNGKVNTKGGTGNLAQMTCHKEKDGDIYFSRDKHVLRVWDGKCDGGARPGGPLSICSIVPYGNGFVLQFKQSKQYLAADASGNCKGTTNINEACNVTFTAR